ncbi:MAG TPA: hypothetical protein VGP44_04420 [Gemmatimonadales bacterium]|nr:hypothetical protein [Gemmatimonadales bacterium]
MRFILAEAGPAWRDWPAFGECCEAAGLSVIQAEAARLASCFLSYREIGEAMEWLLGYPLGRQRTKDHVLHAERRLKRALPHLVAIQRREARALLLAVRNVRGSNPNVAIYRERLGVHDREPVRFASRLIGECVEDLTEAPMRFLRDLPALLTRADESR